MFFAKAIWFAAFSNEARGNNALSNIQMRKLLENIHGILNDGILRETCPTRPSTRIRRAQNIDGFISDDELHWLAQEAMTHKTLIEVGSWHGRSSRSIADNMSNSSTLYCVDHWLGSKAERDTYHQSATLKEGDHAFIKFSENLFDHIRKARVIPLRMSSRNAAELLQKQGIMAGMVFIDAGHTYEEVKDDIYVWLPLVIEGGTICGHDYYHENNSWLGVRQAVDERFGRRGMAYLDNNSIWRHRVGKGGCQPSK
jgi:hypothetical protein